MVGPIKCIRLSECEYKHIMKEVFTQAIPMGKLNEHRLVIESGALMRVVSKMNPPSVGFMLAAEHYAGMHPYTMIVNDL